MARHQAARYITDSPWDSDIKKYARELTIIDIYKHFYGDKLPIDKEYWSMCGAHFAEDGHNISGELGFLLERGLITSNQYRGVDQEESIIEKNKELFPGINWINGDFVDTMLSKISEGNFNPAIINYDGVMQPKFGVRYLKRVLDMVDHNFGDEVIVASTFTLTNPYTNDPKVTYTIADTMRELAKVYWIPDHWEIFPQACVYSGIRQCAVKMGVIIFIKGKHDIHNINHTPNRMIG